MTLNHRAWGRGTVKSLYTTDGTRYVLVNFQSLGADKEMRLDLLTDFPGQYFDDVRSELASRYSEFLERESARKAASDAQRMREDAAEAASIEGWIALLRQRGVNQLVHFTRLENMLSILAHGLFPVSRFPILPFAPLCNDNLRLDGHLDGVSLSVTHPNEALFYKHRRTNAGSRWAVIGIDPSILWRLPADLFLANAATLKGGTVVPTKQYRKPLPEDFDRLFHEPTSGPSRAEMGHTPRDTTNPQSEVLIYGAIPTSAMQSVTVETQEDLRYLKGALEKKMPYARKLPYLEADYHPFDFRPCAHAFRTSVRNMTDMSGTQDKGLTSKAPGKDIDDSDLPF